MNDISRFLYSILYADDICVLLNRNGYVKLIKCLNSQLDKLSVWLKANKLSMNVQKTYYMVFHRAKIKNDQQSNIVMN